MPGLPRTAGAASVARMADTPTRILIHGASGRMGRCLLALVEHDAGLELAAAYAGRADAEATPPLRAATDLGDAPAFDVAVDFSLPPALPALAKLCAVRGAALVSGTTGLDPAAQRALDATARKVPVLWAANFSLGVAVLRRLSLQAAAALPDWDVDIVEQHHRHKRDAPSGTALALGQAIAACGGREPHYASIRAGDIVGEHGVQFTGAGERIELVHRASDREVFARGALFAARRLVDAGPGMHSLEALLFPQA